jgi:hypothetical protein
MVQGYSITVLAPTINYYDCKAQATPATACGIGGSYSTGNKIEIECATNKGTYSINGDP